MTTPRPPVPVPDPRKAPENQDYLQRRRYELQNPELDLTTKDERRNFNRLLDEFDAYRRGLRQPTTLPIIDTIPLDVVAGDPGQYNPNRRIIRTTPTPTIPIPTNQPLAVVETIPEEIIIQDQPSVPTVTLIPPIFTPPGEGAGPPVVITEPPPPPPPLITPPPSLTEAQIQTLLALLLLIFFS